MLYQYHCMKIQGGLRPPAFRYRRPCVIAVFSKLYTVNIDKGPSIKDGHTKSQKYYFLNLFAKCPHCLNPYLLFENFEFFTTKSFLSLCQRFASSY